MQSSPFQGFKIHKQHKWTVASIYRMQEMVLESYQCVQVCLQPEQFDRKCDDPTWRDCGKRDLCQITYS